MNKKTILLVLVICIFTFSGCDLIEGLKWLIGAVNYGRIEGTVTDIEGTAIEGATITSEAIGQGTRPAEETATTDSEGKYTIDMVPPGVHRIKVTKDGHHEKFSSDISVEEATVSETNIEGVYRVAQETALYTNEVYEPFDYVAQSFVSEISSIRAVFLSYYVCTGKAKICEDNSGEPGSSISDFIDYENLTAYGVFEFDTPLNVTVGNKYWIYMDNRNPSQHTYPSREDVYPQGEVLFSNDGNSWQSVDGSYDVHFAILY